MLHDRKPGVEGSNPSGSAYHKGKMTNSLGRKILLGTSIGLLTILATARRTSDYSPLSELEKASINQVKEDTKDAISIFVYGRFNLIREEIDKALENYEKATPNAREHMEKDIENALYFAMRSCVRERNQERLDFYKAKAAEYRINVKGKDLKIK